jgi:glyoxalase family protein
MRLDGIHHVTGITADGQRCLDFYAGILGLAFLGRERDFEAPDSHLLRLGRMRGRPDGVLSFIEAPGIGHGRAGDGMLHTISWGLRSPAALEYWTERLSAAGIEVTQLESGGRARLRFADPEGIQHEFAVDPSANDAGLSSAAIPPQQAIAGLTGVRAYGRASIPSADILAGRLGFRVTGRDSYAVEGEGSASAFSFDPPPPGRGRTGTGSIHHVAWASDGALPAWRQRVIGLGCRATPVIDRGHCRSIYFREPSGVLFEIASDGLGAGERQAPSTAEGRRLSPKVDPRVRAALVG